MLRFFFPDRGMTLSPGAAVRNLLLRTASAFLSLRHPWLRDRNDAPAPKPCPYRESRIAASATLVLLTLLVVAPFNAFSQTTEELQAEQTAIEAGDDLTARAKKALFRARGRQDDGDFAGAAQIMTEFLEGQADREHPLLRFNLALSHLALDENELAFEDLSKAVELEPRYGRAWLRLGEAAYETEKYKDAGEAFGKAYELTPEHTPEILYYSGVSLLTGREPEAALAALEKLLTNHRASAELEWYQALISAGLEADKPGRTKPFIDQLLTDKPSDPDAWELSYQFAASREDYEAAAVSLTIMGYLRPLTRAETIQLGDIYSVISVPLQAARYYETAMAMPAGDVESGRGREFERLASAWLSAHDHERARNTLQVGLGEQETVGLWSLLGDLEYLNEDFQASLTAFSRATEKDSDFGRGWLMMGYCALELGRDTEARAHLDKAATYPDQAASARSLMGRIGS